MTATVTCEDCDGLGYRVGPVAMVRCRECGGTGRVVLKPTAIGCEEDKPCS